MPIPHENWSILIDNPFIAEQLGYNIEEERNLYLQHLENFQCVPEQIDAFTRIANCIDNGQGGGFFLNRVGGTGKTYSGQQNCSSV